MSKSPVLAMLLVPFGSVEGAPHKLALGSASLALLCFVQILILIRLAVKVEILRVAMVVAALSTLVAAPLAMAPAPFLVDGLLSLTVACLLLLVIAEAGDRDRTPSRRDNILRGLVWGWILGVGLLSKLTFLYFAGVAGAAGLALSFYNGGWAASRQKLLGCSISIFIPLLIFLRYLDNYIAHASTSSFGSLSAFYNDGLGRWEYLATTLPELGIWYWGLLTSLIVMAFLFPASKHQRVAALFICLAVLGYLWIAAGSPNKDARFFWPVWAALPFCLAAFVSPRSASSTHSGTTPILAGTVLAILLALPAAVRFDMTAVMGADALLNEISENQPLSVTLASDEPAFNVETILLAREVNHERYNQLALDTVVYDITKDMTREQSLERLVTSDIVVFRDPVTLGAPEWANRHLAFFAQQMRARCAEQTTVGASIHILRNCQ
ncbi:hypothetical protein [Roseobacter sp. MH60115]|uniref:hypothetical protein n=1 Tax=Roseobacter sp. MH60115 TaxID=2785324 RepID=UPI0018A2F5B2|nr:hypothetical protein [Roseobacter sp. MH60115]